MSGTMTAETMATIEKARATYRRMREASERRRQTMLEVAADLRQTGQDAVGGDEYTANGLKKYLDEQATKLEDA